MPIATRVIRSTLISKLGFDEETKRKDIQFRLRIGGTVVAWTMMSHGSRKDIDDNLLSKMAKQMKLGNTKELYNAVDCSLTRDDYYKRFKTIF